MTDILIRGVRMPVACSDCPSRDVSVCVWTDDYNVESYKFSRPSFCPLHKLPEHGDLIDRVAFRSEMDKHYPFDHETQSRHGEADAAKSTVLNMLANAPVIVPASKEESE